MAFGDILSGFAKAGHEHQTNLIQLAYRQRDQLADAYGKLMQDESYPEEARTQFGQAFQDITTSDPFKLPQVLKKYKDMTISVQPSRKIQPQNTTSAPFLDLGQAPGGTTPLGRDYQIPAPVPPPEMAPREQRSIFAPMPFEEQMDRLSATEKIKDQGALDVAKWKAAEWQRQTDFARDMPDGKRHKFVRETRTNPDTGASESREVDLGDIANFAPRMGDIVTLARAKADRDNGLFQFKDINGKDLDIDKMIAVHGPTAVIRNKGAYYEPADIKQQFITFDNQVTGVNPYAPTGPQTVMGTAVPEKVRTNWRPVGVDAQGFNVFEEFDSTTQTATGKKVSVPPGFSPPQGAPPPVPQAVAPPVAPPVAAPMPPTKATPVQSLSTTTSTPPLTERTAARRRTGALAPGIQKDWAVTIRSVRPAAQILYGDANNPDFESLQSFATIADSPERRALVGAAAKTIIQKLGRTGTMSPEAGLSAFGAHASTGGIVTLLTNYLGLPAKQAASEVDVIEKAMAPLTPQEVRMVGRIMAAYGTIVGVRKITSGGAYQFSTEAMEREIPIPGMTGVNSSQSYYNKLAQMGEELVSSTREAPRGLVPEFPAWEKNTAYLNAKGRGWGIAQLPNGDYLFRHEDGKIYDSKGKLVQ